MSTLITIPLPCTLEHLISTDVIPLGSGPLTLLAPGEVSTPAIPSTTQLAEETGLAQRDIAAAGPRLEYEVEDPIVCVLQVGDKSFPLLKCTSRLLVAPLHLHCCRIEQQQQQL